MDQVMIEKTTNIMSKDTKKKTSDITLTEGEVQKIQSDFKDMKDLYNNEVIIRQELSKENQGLQARTLELQSLLNDANQENDETVDDLNKTINEMEKDTVSDETRIDELESQITMLKDIIDKLINA